MDLIPFSGDPFFGGQSGFPRVDVRETNRDVIIVADIPGIEPKKIDIEIVGNAIKMTGKIEEEKETKGKDFYRKERSSRSFARVVSLPCAVNHEGAKAVLKNGTLTVTLRKKNPEETSKKKIPIEEA